MKERRKKLALEQMRTLYHFDVPKFAMSAGVETTTVYHALLLHPIFQKDAEKIVGALSQHTGLQLSLEQIDIVIWEEYSILWLLRASANGSQSELSEHCDEYHFVYARDQEHAKALARSWLEKHSYLPHCYVTACPDGFIIGDVYVPGRQSIDT